MTTRKTRFEQVPVKIAESALRLQSSQSEIIANGNTGLTNHLPRRVGVRRRCGGTIHKDFLGGRDDFDYEQERAAKRGMSKSRATSIETNGVGQDPANGGVDLFRLRLGVQSFGTAAGDSLDEMMQNI